MSPHCSLVTLKRALPCGKKRKHSESVWFAPYFITGWDKVDASLILKIPGFSPSWNFVIVRIICIWMPSSSCFLILSISSPFASHMSSHMFLAHSPLTWYVLFGHSLTLKWLQLIKDWGEFGSGSVFFEIMKVSWWGQCHQDPREWLRSGVHSGRNIGKERTGREAQTCLNLNQLILWLKEI